MDILTDAEWKEVLRVYSAADEPLAKQRVARKRLLADRAAMRDEIEQLQDVVEGQRYMLSSSGATRYSRPRYDLMRADIERLKAENARLWEFAARCKCINDTECTAYLTRHNWCISCEARAKEGQ